MSNILKMLEYTKTILQKVSFSPYLFGKELGKSLQWLKMDEINTLKAWCLFTFGDIYLDIIQEIFRNTNFS
jgi:hypothetical protein